MQEGTGRMAWQAGDHANGLAGGGCPSQLDNGRPNKDDGANVIFLAA